MRHRPQAQRVITAMTYDLTTIEENQLATDLASTLDAYVSNELTDLLYKMAADLLRQRGIDPGTDYGYDLIHDLVNKILITAR
ncbi:MAG: hypothetical protein EBV32_00200 [Proteobacteria bacterium]|uniref:Uncharacterized protein n=1 Tax=Candidatus Fonsibacter lacus TaxID=2576439 RepID=A0A964V208_9PROT|nr:hypothetical protein [Candidatus Fonsibacter lacus]NCU71540.1 hypothetical protein [Candidatus Fonsibacter lacus]